jgi:hypothetical protein
MEYYGKATKRARERAKATQQEHEDAVRKLGIPRAVAMHLLELETKIAQLDQNKR